MAATARTPSKRISKPSTPPPTAPIPGPSRSQLVRDQLRSNPKQTNSEIALLVGCSPGLVGQQRQIIERVNVPVDEVGKWGDLLSTRIPASLRVATLKRLITSENPVAASRALEIVLESAGLKRKIAEPSRTASILVQSDADAGFD